MKSEYFYTINICAISFSFSPATQAILSPIQTHMLTFLRLSCPSYLCPFVTISPEKNKYIYIFLQTCQQAAKILVGF